MIRLVRPWLRNPEGMVFDLPYQQEQGLIFMKIAERVDAPDFKDEIKAVEKSPKNKMIKKEEYARK
jgi:hypothetical protein